jgi:hypothetical protein
MDYLEVAEKVIREKWFADHVIKSIEGKNGFQRIVWGKKGTRMYQIEYVLSDNMVFVSGDLGDAVYSLTCMATLNNIKDFDLSYFTSKLTAYSSERWDFDQKLAQKQIKEYFLEWCDVEDVDELTEDEQELYQTLINATIEWDDYKAFETLGVWSTYYNTNVDWFDSETASCIASCGKRLPYCFVAYWLGLKMIAEQLEETNLKLA